MARNTVLIVALGLVGIIILVGLAELVRYNMELQESLQQARLEGTAVAATLEAENSITPTAEQDDSFTIAFVSDSETMSRWDEVLEMIAKEGADMMIHNGDYVDGINPQTMEPATMADLLSEEVLDGDGNPTGEFNCERELVGIRCILGGDFPVLGPAVGKNLGPELEEYFLRTLERLEGLGASWGGCVMDGDNGSPGVRMSGCYLGDDVEDARAADYWLRWNGITMVFQNAMHDRTWVPSVLAGDQNIWKLCIWHGNHIDFQTGDKGNGYDGRDYSLPYEMYRNCADQGALIINGNEHTYSRTCVMEDIGNLNNGGPSTRNRVNREPGTELENHGAVCPSAGMDNVEAAGTVEQLEIGPGRSMVLVSAVAGYSWRDYLPEVESELEQDAFRHDRDGWWATVFTSNRYCRNNCTLPDLSGQNPDAFVPGMNPPLKVVEPADAPWDPYSDGHGVLFITFNYEGDPYKAHGYFKKLVPDLETGREIVDEFIITYVP